MLHEDSTLDCLDPAPEPGDRILIIEDRAETLVEDLAEDAENPNRHGVWTVYAADGDYYAVTFAPKLSTRTTRGWIGDRTVHPHADPVPAGLAPRPGVQYGCGSAACDACYQAKSVAV